MVVERKSEGGGEPKKNERSFTFYQFETSDLILWGVWSILNLAQLSAHPARVPITCRLCLGSCGHLRSRNGLPIIRTRLENTKIN